VGRKEPLIGRNRHNRDADRVRLVRERKPIDPDAALVQRLRRREEAAVTALVVGSATRKIDRLRGTAAFRSWLYRITLNAACQKRRGRRAEGLLPFAERLPC